MKCTRYLNYHPTLRIRATFTDPSDKTKLLGRTSPYILEANGPIHIQGTVNKNRYIIFLEMKAKNGVIEEFSEEDNIQDYDNYGCSQLDYVHKNSYCEQI